MIRSFSISVTACAALLIAFPSFGFVQKYAGIHGVIVYTLMILAFLFVGRRVLAFVSPHLNKHFPALCLVSSVALAGAFVILHPMEEKRGVGKSSDRNEGLNLAVHRAFQGDYPYYKQEPTAGPLSVLPGAILLAAPFVALGDSSYQNLFWLALYWLAAFHFLKDRLLAMLVVLVPLAVSPASIYEYVSGGDLFTNSIYLSVFLLFVWKCLSDPGTGKALQVASLVLLGVGIASRMNFILLLPLMGSAFASRFGWRIATSAMATVVLTALCLTIPFFLHDPSGFTPLMSRQKLAVVDHALPFASLAILAVSGIVSLAGSWVLWINREPARIDQLFRWCAMVTLTPILLTVAASSIASGNLDFQFLRDRFGLMYLGFALLGWGGLIKMSAILPGEPEPCLGEPHIHP